MHGDVMDLRELDRTRVAVAGGKGAHLGELCRIEGTAVPAGFCVTTAAFRRVLAGVPSFDDRLERLARLGPGDGAAVRALSADLREAVEGAPVPADLAAAITRAPAAAGPRVAWAVRSSATAEDLPTASFAGQHDTYLDIVGPAAVLRHVRRCWGSLFTERAVVYRMQTGVDHRTVRMAVVVQRMVVPRAAGILFTADPVTSNRRVAAIEAVPGPGEALVSGLVGADSYAVRDGEVVSRTIAATRQPALTDWEALRLAGLGRRIEAHLGAPQDIEWCLDEDGFHIVQSRPITTLFPLPAAGDGRTHVYVSVGHQQMMTDAMKALGLSLWQLTTPRPMAEAGGRLFVDVAPILASPAGRAGLLDALGSSDPLIGDALRTVLARGDLIRPLPDDGPPDAHAGGPPEPMEADPAIVTELIARSRASLAALERDIRTTSGAALIDLVLADVARLRAELFDPRSLRVITAAMDASRWLNERLHEWLGERNAADALTRSVPHNVTSQMGLALLDVGDAIRPHPEVVAFLERVEDDDADLLDGLAGLAGGPEARAALRAYLDRYGMRCAGEIDITRPRWSERPAALVPMILGNVRNSAPGAGRRLFEQGRREAAARERELIVRLRALPDGEQKAADATRMIARVRAFSGYREYPKYGMVSRYAVYKRALMGEAGRLVRAGVLRRREDIFHLRIEELAEVVRTGRVDDGLIRRRREAFRSYRALTPPRVLTSDGEVIAGAYRRQGVPAGALVGLPVSAGSVEGRARVVMDIAAADLGPGDILVTTYTDPSWTPLFVGITGLVTEVGGLMTHGAVIAREYGLPAVVGVPDATRLIRDGQRIRVHGTDGYVEVLRTARDAT